MCIFFIDYIFLRKCVNDVYMGFNCPNKSISINIINMIKYIYIYIYITSMMNNDAFSFCISAIIVLLLLLLLLLNLVNCLLLLYVVVIARPSLFHPSMKSMVDSVGRDGHVTLRIIFLEHFATTFHVNIHLGKIRQSIGNNLVENARPLLLENL